MKQDNIALVAIHEAKLIEPKAWLSTTWTIYESLHTIINIRYNNNDSKERDYDIVISEDDYTQILDTLELAKREDRKIFSFDVDTWAFKQYLDGAIIYRRLDSPITGLDEFEKLSVSLEKLIKKARPAGQ
jgi:hypothetical protein